MEKKKRSVLTTEKNQDKIDDNVKNSKYSQETKEYLKIQAKRLNELMEKNQISQDALRQKLGVSSGAISNYSGGSKIINSDILLKLAKEFDTSTDYLLGFSDVKHYSNNEINKLFGFNDDTINNLSSMPNKDNINFLFGKNRDEVLYFFEKLDEYKKALNKYNEEKKKDVINKVWEQDHLNIAKYYLTEAFNNLINE